MKKTIIIFIILNFDFNTFAQDLTVITGYIDNSTTNVSSQKTLKLRTPTEDILIDFSKLDEKTQALISKAHPKKKLTIYFKKEALIERKNTPMGIRADCSEIPTDMDELEEIAKGSNDMLDFLKKIPEGSLQSFTFVTNSLSLHRGKKDANGEGQVSEMWPRVLRSSVDGKLTVSFVCDPKNQTFGKVEIMHFDDKEKEFKTTEFDFGHPESAKKVAPSDRIHKNPESCITCHAGSEINGKTSLKPNWPGYFQWSDCKENRGIQFYGGNDDNMEPGVFRKPINQNNDCSNLQTKAQTIKEQNSYLKFREKQKENECFNSLPWPKPKKDTGSYESNWTYKYYPYASYAQERHLDSQTGESYFNYALRTNLRFTDTYSHLMSQSIANILSKNPNYNTVKYLLAMEQAGCKITDDEIKAVNNVMDVVPGFSLKQDKYNPNRSSQLETTPLLAEFSKIVGLAQQDWTMEFQEKKNSDYVSAMPNQNDSLEDLRINQVVGGEILKNISANNQVIATVSENAITRGVTNAFSSRFSCIDDLGGAIIKPSKSTHGEKDSPLCSSLRSENRKNIEMLRNLKPINNVNCNSAVSTNPVIQNLAGKIEKTVQKFNLDQIARGKKLVEMDSKGKCVECHSASTDILPREFRFIPSESDPNKKESILILRARQDEMSRKLERKLITSKTMPPAPYGDDLTDEDRADVKAYILSIADGDE